MEKSNYLIWESRIVPHACVLGRLSGVDKMYELTEGVRRQTGFPASASFPMDPDFPNDLLLTDSLMNSGRLVVGSLALKKLIENHADEQVEYLPVRIIDHKKKIASRDYFIIHPIDPVDCLKIDECGAEWGLIDTESIDSVERLVLDPSRIPAERVFFRAKFFEDVIFVTRALAAAIDAAGLTGIRWIELTDYPET